MHRTLERRSFLKTMALGLGTMALPPAFAKKKPAKKLKIGHTCITWGTFPRPGDDATLEPALKDISAEGFWSFETFPEVLDNWDKRGLLAPMIAKYGVPLRSGYITGNLIDPTKRKDEIDRIVRLAKVVQKFNGTFIVLAPNSVKRDAYNFQEHKADIISALNDYAAAVTARMTYEAIVLGLFARRRDWSTLTSAAAVTGIVLVLDVIMVGPMGIAGAGLASLAGYAAGIAVRARLVAASTTTIQPNGRSTPLRSPK